MDNASISEIVRLLRTGDSDGAQRLWDQYFDALVGYSQRRFPGPGVDPESLALSALKSFCLGVRNGRFPKLTDDDNLWWLLVRITFNKGAERIQAGKAQKRGGGRVAGEAALGEDGFEQVAHDGPQPEFIAQLNELTDLLFERLPDEKLRAVANFKLAGHTNREIAKSLNCSRSTLDRKLKIIRDTLENINDR